MAVTTKRGFLRQAWHLAWPYWNSEEKWTARGLLLAVISLNLITVGLNVRLNTWNNGRPGWNSTRPSWIHNYNQISYRNGYNIDDREAALNTQIQRGITTGRLTPTMLRDVLRQAHDLANNADQLQQ